MINFTADTPFVQILSKSCATYNDFRDRVWPYRTLGTQKFYGYPEDLHCNAQFMKELRLSFV